MSLEWFIMSLSYCKLDFHHPNVRHRSLFHFFIIIHILMSTPRECPLILHTVDCFVKFLLTCSYIFNPNLIFFTIHFWSPDIVHTIIGLSHNFLNWWNKKMVKLEMESHFISDQGCEFSNQEVNPWVPSDLVRGILIS